MAESAQPLTPTELESDTWASWWGAHAAMRDLCAAGITGMDVPTERWTKEDAAYWTGTARYQPWRDVADLFRPKGDEAGR